MNGSFGCAINCIDGRAQTPVIDWVKFHAGVQYVDMITEPGADGVVSNSMEGDLQQVYRNVKVSVQAHSPSIIAVAGHFDCAGNPVSNEQHLEQVEKSARVVREWYPEIRVVGLFVNEYGTVDVVSDTHSAEDQIQSFL